VERPLNSLVFLASFCQTSYPTFFVRYICPPFANALRSAQSRLISSVSAFGAVLSSISFAKHARGFAFRRSSADAAVD
jgi:hypothetical protein